MAPDPFGQLGLRAARIKLDLVPVCVLQEFSVGEAELLGAGIANEAVRGQYGGRSREQRVGGRFTGTECARGRIGECCLCLQSVGKRLVRWHLQLLALRRYQRREGRSGRRLRFE